MISFDEAFAAARKANQKLFWWNGCQFTTERADRKPLASDELASARHRITELEKQLKSSEARCAELRECLSCMQSHYVTTLEAGHDRITFLGGDCDSVQRMLSDNPDYARSVKLLAQSVPARHTMGNCPDCGHDNVLCACGYKS